MTWRLTAMLAVVQLGLGGCLSREDGPNPPLVLSDAPGRLAKRFVVDDLSSEQRSSYAAFKAASGPARYAAFQEILRTDALPTRKFKMSQEDIVNLLGNPLEHDLFSLCYRVESGQRTGYLTIKFRYGHAIAWWYEETTS